MSLRILAYNIINSKYKKKNSIVLKKKIALVYLDLMLSIYF